jgi:hypothetical protein
MDDFYILAKHGPHDRKKRGVKRLLLLRIKERRCVTRVNSANVLDEGLRIGGRGRQMNSKVKIRQTR